MEVQETEATVQPSVQCDGGPGALGHPRVYLKIDDGGSVKCPYCDKLFVLKAEPSDQSAA